VDSDGNAKVNKTFYFMLFTDKALTQPVANSMISVKLNGASTGTATFTNLPLGTFYVAEVDKNGNPVASDDDFGYKVSYSSNVFTYRELEANGGTVTVTNKEKAKEGSGLDQTDRGHEGSGYEGG